MLRGGNMWFRPAISIWFVFAQSFFKFHKNGDIRKLKAWSFLLLKNDFCRLYNERARALQSSITIFLIHPVHIPPYQSIVFSLIFKKSKFWLTFVTFPLLFNTLCPLIRCTLFQTSLSTFFFFIDRTFDTRCPLLSVQSKFHPVYPLLSP